MNKYSKFDIQKVADGADIRDFIPGCMRKSDQMVECPFCHSKKMSVVHKGGKNFAHCFACEGNFPDAIAAVRFFRNLDFIPALEAVAQEAGIIITPEERVKAQAVDAAVKASTTSFCRQQLESSGLTEEDVIAHVVDEKGRDSWVSPFQKGGIDAPFRPNSSDDEMLIYYYGLDGRRMTYVVRGASARALPYVRVRWSNPSAHTDSSGKEMKYQTPAGAPSRIYIPQRIRQSYQNKTHIETLFIQEGEKKAEKACKHGVPSIGIQGINNFGSVREGLLQDIQYLVKACSVNNVVLLMDADWDDLHRKIVVGDAADKRPNSFSKAVIKFKTYINTLHNLGLSVDVWWGHVNHNESGDKGIDDLLCHSLKGKESELCDDIQHAMHTHDGKGRWVDIHKITAVSDRQIQDFWLLNDSQAFYDRHKARLESVETFKINRIRYKVEDGKLVQVNRYSSDVDIYSIEHDSKDREKVVFNMMETLEFLKANGFYRLRTFADGVAGYDYIHIDDGIIDRTTSVDIRNFIFDYIKSTCKIPIVQEFFATKIDALLADKKLERLGIVDDDFNDFSSGVQRCYYNNGQVEITSDEIVPMKPISNVWRSRIVARNFRRVPIISSISKVGDEFYIELTKEGAACEFLSFLFNTSNNAFPHDSPRELSPEESKDYRQNIVNKITTIGYLLCDYKIPSELKAVVIQDHTMAEVGQSNGRSGKSMIGEALKHVTSQYYIDGKSTKGDDEFMFSGVTQSTRTIFFDDVKTNFNFERLYSVITADMMVNPKGRSRFTIDNANSPKLLITTNHAINGAETKSSKARIAYMEFSAFYNDEHLIVDDFHHLFFNDWDENQWNLFDNLMAECCMYYLRSYEQLWFREGQGAVPPPMRNITLRTLRQEMSEVLYQWAEEFFDPSGSNLNQRLKRNDLISNFYEFAGTTGHGVTRTNFKTKILAYCRFKGFDFNINRPNKDGVCCSDWKKLHPDEPFIGESDKSGGAEYFTIFSAEKEKELKPF